MHYGGYGEPFKLWLEEDGVLSKAWIPTKDAEEILNFNFVRTKITSKVIMASEYLKEIFAELDATSEVLEFAFSTDKTFTISTFGQAAEVKMSVSNVQRAWTQITTVNV